MAKYCRVCGEELIVGENWLFSAAKKRNYICRKCTSIKGKISTNYLNRDKWYCRVCGTELIVNKNWWISFARIGNSICKKCRNVYINEHNHEIGVSTSMHENKDSTMYLGCVIAERVVEKFFKKSVVRMKYSNPGYDIICSNGYRIDVKSSILHKDIESRKPHWEFRISKNKIADYFLCLGFDDRKNLNILKHWMIPGHVINNKNGIRMSENTFHKWRKYEIDSSPIDECCTTLKSRRG
jgi:hypothetical protein